MQKFILTMCFFLMLAQISFAQSYQQSRESHLRNSNSFFDRQNQFLQIESENISNGNSLSFGNDRFPTSILKGNPYHNQFIFSPQTQNYVIDTALIIWTEDEYNPADTSRYLYSFNAGAKRTLELKQRLIDGSWMNDSRKTATYDASNNMLTDLWEWWSEYDGQWINNSRHTYTYDTHGNMLTDLFEGWENGQWINSWRDTYTYDTQGNMLTALDEGWDNGQWIIWSGHTYTYDAQGNMLTDLGEVWENGQWINVYRNTYTYDTQGDMLTNLGESWENGQWINSLLETYTYDTQGNMLTGLYEYWWNGQWNNSWLNSFIYDSQGNMLIRLSENWKNNQWINSWLETFTYDMQGNLTSFWSYQWFESSWIPANFSSYSGYVIYDMAGNEYHYWGHNFIFTYKLIVTEVVSNDANIPGQYTLWQNYPNPFNPTTKIKYSVPQTSNVVIKVFDVLGNEIETLVNEEKHTGTYEITWYAEGIPSGVYFYKLRAGDFIQTRKMVLTK